MRFSSFRVLAGALVLLLSTAVTAQPYPGKPIKLMLGIGPGSSADGIGRVVTRRLADRLGQPIVIEHRLGAGGTLAAEAVTKAAPDGYTLLWGTSSIPIFKHLYALKFDPAADLQPIGNAAFGAMVLVGRNDGKPASVPELIAKARSKPGAVTFASAGIGSNAHLASAMFGHTVGATFLHVPYKSSAAGLVDVISGQVDFVFDALLTALPHIKSGALKVYAVSTPTRSSFLPNVPTLDEAGVAGFSHPIWLGLFAPAGTPKAIVDKLSTELQAVTASSAYRDELAAIGLEPGPGTSTLLVTQVRDETAKWDQSLRAMKLDLRGN